ncbi:hypothetical protein, partial [Enterococcus faecalis]|uniref:hypothetical protein n=1 Tax=Enterococcus faecalis TaxID=1351 RepID=UPI00403F1D26
RAKGVPPASSWYAAAARAFDALGVAAGEGARDYRGAGAQPAFKAQIDANASASAPIADLPDWVRRPVPEEARPPRPLAPSALGADDVADP